MGIKKQNLVVDQITAGNSTDPILINGVLTYPAPGTYTGAQIPDATFVNTQIANYTVPFYQKFYAAGVSLPITITGFQGLYPNLKRFPQFKVTQVLGQAISTGNITGGSGYTNGTYTNISLTGGTGAGAKATIVVAGGIVTGVTITTSGSNYASGDQLTATGFGSGTGFKFTLTAVTAPQFQYLNNFTVKTIESTIGLPDTVTINVDNLGGVLGDNILITISN